MLFPSDQKVPKNVMRKNVGLFVECGAKPRESDHLDTLEIYNKEYISRLGGRNKRIQR